MRYNILFLTDLPVWSLEADAGAKSFFETLQYYNREHNLTLASSQKNVEGYNYKYLRHYNVHRITNNKLLKLFLKPILFVLNTIISYKFIASHIDDVDVIYCYEIAHVLPAKLAIFLNKNGKIFVTRFQGTILNFLLTKMKFHLKWYHSLRNFDHILALKVHADIVIMTDDGTQGDRVLKLLNNSSKTLFLKNGVETYGRLQKKFDASELNFVTCSRLVKWKRVDRAIRVFSIIKNRFPDAQLNIIGDGPCRNDLVCLCEDLNITDSVCFHGALKHKDTITLMSKQSVLLSCFNLSNVGNPLWEAQALGLWIGTIDNGDTSMYVVDAENGSIVPEERYLDLGDKLIEQLLCKQKQSPKMLNYSDIVSWNGRLSVEAKHIKRLILQRKNNW